MIFTMRRRKGALYHTDSVESTSKFSRSCIHSPHLYTILTLWSQLQNGSMTTGTVVKAIPYWLCGVNFKIGQTMLRGISVVYHTDSVESTSKCGRYILAPNRAYTILTLWSQLQNWRRRVRVLHVPIPYWLCGVNFKMWYGVVMILKTIYHTDSVESTSKFSFTRFTFSKLYTILTLWSQLQNGFLGGCAAAGDIPYWLCGVNFKIWASARSHQTPLYHTDSVESTSKCDCGEGLGGAAYTILTLWSQLQNNGARADITRKTIPYWLCGVNFKMRRVRRSMRRWLYHTDSVESTSKSGRCPTSRTSLYTILTLWSQLQNEWCPWNTGYADIPYWLCGVNFKIALPRIIVTKRIYHTDSVESTSK